MGEEDGAPLEEFKMELKALAEQAGREANKELTTQASELSAMLEEISEALDSVSQRLSE